MHNQGAPQQRHDGVGGHPPREQGMNEVGAAAFWLSRPATPSMAPDPTGGPADATFLSIVYDANDAISGPPPGRTPRIEPSNVPRAVDKAARCKPPGCARIRRIDVDTSERWFGDASAWMISARPTMPMATGMKPMPSNIAARPT